MKSRSFVVGGALWLLALPFLVPAVGRSASGVLHRQKTVRVQSVRVQPVATTNEGATEGDDPAPNEHIVTDADNGSEVTLEGNATLIVRLSDNPSTGYSWAPIMIPGMPLRLVEEQLVGKQPGESGKPPIVGAPRTREFKFVTGAATTSTQAVYLKLLHLRPFAKGIADAKLWEVKVIIPGA